MHVIRKINIGELQIDFRAFSCAFKFRKKFTPINVNDKKANDKATSRKTIISHKIEIHIKGILWVWHIHRYNAVHGFRSKIEASRGACS